MQERRLLAAHKRPGALLERHLEIETRVKDVRTEQAERPRLADRVLQARYGQRVLGADVDVGLRRADPVRCNRETLEQPVGVALDHRPVHERARVPLVGVADQVLLIRRLLVGDCPLGPGPEPAASSTPQAALFHDSADLGRRLLAQRLGQAGVAAARQVLVEARRIDESTVGEHQPLLWRKEGMLVEKRHILPARRPVLAELPERGDRPRLRTAEHGIEQARDQRLGDTRKAQARAAGQLHVDERLLDAQADAADLDDLSPEVGVLVQVAADRGARAACAGAEAAGAGADEDDWALEPLAESSRADSLAPGAAGVALVAERTVREALNELGAGTRRRVPAFRAARSERERRR